MANESLFGKKTMTGENSSHEIRMRHYFFSNKDLVNYRFEKKKLPISELLGIATSYGLSKFFYLQIKIRLFRAKFQTLKTYVNFPLNILSIRVT